MWHIVLNYVTVSYYRNNETSLYILSVFRYCILIFSWSCYGNLSCVTVGGNSGALSLYRFILWPRLVIHIVPCLSALKSKNAVFLLQYVYFYSHVYVCIILLRSLMEVHIFDSAHTTQFECQVPLVCVMTVVQLVGTNISHQNVVYIFRLYWLGRDSIFSWNVGTHLPDRSVVTS